MQLITHDLPKKPAAKIVVEGLFILCINEQTRTAELGIYEYANEHEFFIRVSKKKYSDITVAGKGGEEIARLSAEFEIPSGDVSINLAEREPDITCYNHPELSSDSFRSDATDLTTSVFKGRAEFISDFRWVIDIEGERFRSQRMKIVPGILKRKIKLSNGIICTEKWASREVKSAFPLAADMAGHNIGSLYFWVAAKLGIYIPTMTDNQELILAYSEDGIPATLPLPQLEEGAYYEILLSNNCPEGLDKEFFKQSDFQCYYNVFDVPASLRLDFAALSGQGNERYPCDVVFLGATTELP